MPAAIDERRLGDRTRARLHRAPGLLERFLRERHLAQLDDFEASRIS